MSVCRRTSRVYCDVDDLDGVLNVLAKTVHEGNLTETAANFIKGAYYAVDVIRYHEWVDNCHDFMAILSNYYLDEYNENLEGTYHA